MVSDEVWLAIVVAVPTVAASTIAPILLSLLNSRSARVQKREEYARQDAVAAATRQVADKLEATSARSDAKLDVIHGLVNSAMTEAIKSELKATRRVLVLLKELSGDDPSPETQAEIKSVREDIDRLTEAIAARESVPGG